MSLPEPGSGGFILLKGSLEKLVFITKCLLIGGCPIVQVFSGITVGSVDINKTELKRVFILKCTDLKKTKLHTAEGNRLFLFRFITLVVRCLFTLQYKILQRSCKESDIYRCMLCNKVHLLVGGYSKKNKPTDLSVENFQINPTVSWVQPSCTLKSVH